MNCALADPTNIAHDYNVLAIDRSPVINTSYQFYIGDRVHGNRALEGVANGWTIAGITLLQSGPDLASTYETNFGLALANTAKTGPYSIPVDNKTWIGTPDVSLQPALLCNPTSGLGKDQ